jgi:hypothetical protein
LVSAALCWPNVSADFLILLHFIVLLWTTLASNLVFYQWEKNIFKIDQVGVNFQYSWYAYLISW